MIPVRWLLVKTGEEPADDAWLAPAERDHLETLRIPHRREDWRLGRWAAKKALAAALDLPADSLARLEIRPAEDGAPEPFLDGNPVPWDLSLTHRDGHAAAAVAPAGTALGCDLECVEPRSGLFVQDYFTEAERAVIETDRLLLANLLWSAKESVLKALRVGLRMDTRDVEVTLSNDEAVGGWRTFAVRHRASGRRFEGWWRREGGMVATVVAGAVERTDQPISLS
ncbi:MAG TPA: 4'-phosphopantetheinyl transferase superfamily protein [Thermoanaerobaculia bacterium]|nr:4'-phosphopantetheinyl transferase superfamily protein [Thermoanaerobaculia bacterium]